MRAPVASRSSRTWAVVAVLVDEVGGRIPVDGLALADAVGVVGVVDGEQAVDGLAEAVVGGIIGVGLGLAVRRWQKSLSGSGVSGG